MIYVACGLYTASVAALALLGCFEWYHQLYVAVIGLPLGVWLVWDDVRET